MAAVIAVSGAGGFRVDPAELAAHAERVGGYGARLRTAAAAARPVAPGAYGEVGTLFAWALVDASGRAGTALARLADAAQDHGRDLHACVADYVGIESAIAQSCGSPALGSPALGSPALGSPW